MVGVNTLVGTVTVMANVPSDCTGDSPGEEGDSLHSSSVVYLQRQQTLSKSR